MFIWPLLILLAASFLAESNHTTRVSWPFESLINTRIWMIVTVGPWLSSLAPAPSSGQLPLPPPPLSVYLSSWTAAMRTQFLPTDLLLISWIPEWSWHPGLHYGYGRLMEILSQLTWWFFVRSWGYRGREGLGYSYWCCRNLSLTVYKTCT